MSQALDPSTRRWRLGDLVAEAQANVAAPGARQRAPLVLAVLFGVVLAVAVSSEERAFTAEVARLSKAGYFTYQIVSLDPKNSNFRVDGRTCRQLGDRPGVLRSSILIEGEPSWIAQIGRTVPTAWLDYRWPDVSDTAVEMTKVDRSSNPSLWLGPSLGVDPETRFLQVSDGGGARWARDSTEPAALGVAGTAIWSTNLDLMWGPRCLLQFAPGPSNRRTLSSFLSSVDTRGGPGVIRPLMAEQVSDPFESFENRWSRQLPLVVGCLFGAVLALLLIARSSEIGTYRVSGTRRTDMAAILFGEFALVLGAMFASGIAALATVTLAGGGIVSAGSIASSALAALAPSSFAMVILLLRNPNDLLKDR